MPAKVEGSVESEREAWADTLALPLILVDVDTLEVLYESDNVEELLAYAVEYRDQNSDDPDLVLAIYKKEAILT